MLNPAVQRCGRVRVCFEGRPKSFALCCGGGQKDTEKKTPCVCEVQIIKQVIRKKEKKCPGVRNDTTKEKVSK